MRNRKLWLILLAIVALAGAGFYFRNGLLNLINRPTAGTVNAQNSAGAADLAGVTTTTIRPAADSVQVSASGNIALADQRAAVLQVEGVVAEVAVEVGDQVGVDDVLVALSTTDLERAVAQAELNLESSQAQLDKLLEPADAAEIASARASLLSAQENLAEVKAGPSEAELAAAVAKLAAARARYEDLLAGPSDAELTQLSASFEKTAIDLQQAQWAYDRVAYTGQGAASQAAALQQATIDYEAARAALEIATEPASEADLQDALNAIQTAQEQLDDLRAQPTAADIAAAEAQVSSAQAQLDNLLNGPTKAELRAAEISVEQAQLNLDAAREALAQAQLRAPIAGAVLAVDVEVGQKVNAGLAAATLADLSDLELTVNVAEVDVSKIQAGQIAEITIDALPDRVFTGVVDRIAPTSASESGVVNYPVTIRLTGPDLAGVRPGMTAVATIRDEALAGSWLVPTAALRERQGETMVVVLRNGQPTPISVTSAGSQGEWTIVQSAELQAGDEAVGGVSSFLNQGDTPRGFGPPGAFGGRPQ